MLLADAHAHLFLVDEALLSQIISRAQQAGVKAIINNGTDAETNRKCLLLSEKYPIMKSAIGLYPTDALKLDDEQLSNELKFIQKNKQKILAVGEIGLDYEETEDRKRQQEIFEKQLALATRLKKPVIVHSRKAESKVVETLISVGQKNVVLHAFHGKLKLAKKAEDAGFYITIPCNINRSSQFQTIAKNIALANLLTETDSPYLAPEKGKMSEPAMIAKTIEKIAQIKGTTKEDTSLILFNNFRMLFR